MSDENEDGVLEIIFQWLLCMGQAIFEKIIEPFILLPLATLLHIKKIYAGLIITGLATILFIGITKLVQTTDNKENNYVVQPNDKMDIDYPTILPGLYSVSAYYEDNKLYSLTAEIQFYKNDEYKLIMVGEYNPEFINITIDKGGCLISDKIGRGVLTYKKRIDKITIIFNKEKYSWKFLK